MSLYLDDYGAVVTRNRSQGDSCAHTFRWWLALWWCGANIPDTWVETSQNFVTRLGIGSRHYRSTEWLEPRNWSRDQQTPAVLFLYEKDDPRFSQLLTRHFERKWKYQNKDWASAEHRNYYRPTKRSLTGDLLLVGSSVIRVLDSYLCWDESAGRSLNHDIVLIFFERHWPTLLSRVAVRINRLRKNGVQWAWDWYYRDNNPDGTVNEYGGNSDIAKLMAVSIEKYL